MPNKVFEKTPDGIGNTEPESSAEDKNIELKNQAQLEIKKKIEKELTHGPRADCAQRIKAEAAPFLGDKQEKIFKALDEASTIQDDEEFVTAVSELLRPLVDMKIDDPEAYETIRRQRHDYVRVNDLLAYNIGAGGDYIQLHVFPSEERKDKLGLLKEGMRKLAVDVNASKNIKFVSATSWIVASNPHLLELLGFEIEGPIDEETREKDFKDDPRPISRATISREKLLEKYL